MSQSTVVVAQCDPRDAEHMAVCLHAHFDGVAIARNPEELRRTILKHRAEAVVVDLEMVTVEELAALRRDFAHISFVCTHRVPDEEMWTTALAAGASDCCQNSDLPGIVAAVTRGPRRPSHSAA